MRLKRLREAMSQRGLDALLISQAENRRYLSGFTGSAGYLLITQEKATLAVDFRYQEQAQTQAPDFQAFRIQGELPRWFPELVADLRGARLGFEAENVSMASYEQMTTALRGLENPPHLVPTQGLVSGLRAVKEPSEVERIQRAVSLADDAFRHILTSLRPGMREMEIAWELEKYLKEHGSQDLPYDIIVASGTNSSMPHHRTGDRPIQEGDPILMDFGARIDGYVSDLTRTISFGRHPDDKFKEVYDAVLGAQLTALATLRPGMTGHQADRLARAVLEPAGWGEAFGHGLGHGLGLVVHEEPRLGPESPSVLAPGMVFTVEPGVYLPGWGGIRIEDVVVLEAGGARGLTRASKEYVIS